MQNYIHTLSTQLYNQFRQLLAPAFCAHCRVFLDVAEYDHVLCASCKEKISRVTSVSLSLAPGTFLTVLAAAAYEPPVRDLVRAKHRSDRVAAKRLAQLMLDLVDVEYSTRCDYIVPVPLHWRRYAQRGFNQAEIIAQVLGAHMRKPVLTALTRTRATVLQASLEVHERSANVHQVFALKEHARALIEDKRVLIVDDLLTTGSTLTQAGRALLAARPKAIEGLVACRAL